MATIKKNTDSFSRTVEFEALTHEGARFTLTITHRNAGTYNVSIRRSTLKNGIIETRLMEDSLTTVKRSTPTTRYSLKNLETLASEYEPAFAELYETHKDWTDEVLNRK